MSRNAHCLLLVLALSLAFSGLLSAEPQPRIVDSEGGLRLRDAPGLSGKLIAVILDGREVLLLEEKPEVLSISRSTGKWTRVAYSDPKNFTGWVFGGFLVDPYTPESRSLLKRLAGFYNALDEKTDPGYPPAWLRISETAVSSGHSGSMEARWYCLVAQVARNGDRYTIQGDLGRKPIRDEVGLLAWDAQVGDGLTILATAPDTLRIGDKMYRRSK
jgi:hypothetical protein